MSGTGQQAKTGKEGPLMWIDAYKSVTNQLNTYGNNIELADVEETGENKLVVADFNGMVTIYKGTNVDWQFQLQDPVNCIGQFTINSGKMKPMTILAVASDRYIYMFHQRQKYRRLMMYYIETDPNESSIWSSFTGEIDAISTFLVALNDLKNTGVKLSPASLNILMLETIEEQLQFYEIAKNGPHFVHDNATCMGSIYSVFEVPGSASQLVIGTEFKWLLICNESGGEFIHQFQLPEVPFKLITRGTVTKEYSIYVIARNNKFIHFSNGSVKDMISLDSTPNDIARVEDNIFISSNTGLIQIFSLTAVPLRSISLVENVQGIANLYLERLGTSKGIAVVGSGRLTVYNTTGVALINSTTTDDEVVALKFGKIGREEGCLFMLYKNRGIEIKILNKRMFGTIENVKESSEVVVGTQKPELKPPARSRIFAEQLEVDKEKSAGTYANYQKDALRLKILVDSNYLKLMDRGMISDSKKVKIHADIEGIGPVFKVKLELTNQGQKPLTDLVLSLQFNKTNYTILDSLPEAKFLLPNIMLPVIIKIRNISTLGSNEDIKVFLSHKHESKPIAGAVINMPVCDPNLNL